MHIELLSGLYSCEHFFREQVREYNVRVIRTYEAVRYTLFANNDKKKNLKIHFFKNTLLFHIRIKFFQN